MSALVYKCGQRVPASGIYRVSHAEHRLPHEVTLVKDELFPPCMKCGKAVRFTMIRAVQEVDGLREKIILNSIPESEDAA